jgi:argininosuccinate lyase
VLTVRGALESRTTHGGTAPVRVGEQLSALADAANEHAAWASGAG